MLPLIPYPQQLTLHDGYFNLTDNAVLKANPELRPTIKYFCEKIEKLCSITTRLSDNEKAQINFLIDHQNSIKSFYRIKVESDKIELSATSEEFLFYGCQTLLQLIFFAERGQKNLKIPLLEIDDAPEYRWRGMHLDVSRHFFSVDTIKKQLDLLAFYKMNIFHWHLTDDQGWRIEIKKYPKLTEIGSKRKNNNGEIYRGFYTQDEISEIVEYAARRHITVVPEIDMPGHTGAAITSYPELSCHKKEIPVQTEWGIFKDIFCAGSQFTYQFIEDVLSEIVQLFPSQYIHIGGDEVPKEQWQNCPVCRDIVKKQKLKNYDQLHGFFVNKLEKILKKYNRTLIGWDEILDGDISDKAVVMSWRSVENGLKAVNRNHRVIMSPTEYAYFDYYQAKKNQPKAIGGYLPAEKVYQFSPMPESIDVEKRDMILGGQANVWTEYIDSEHNLEYMIYPRLLAMAEKLYSCPTQQNFPGFLKRIKQHSEILDIFNINYCRDIP